MPGGTMALPVASQMVIPTGAQSRVGFPFSEMRKEAFVQGTPRRAAGSHPGRIEPTVSRVKDKLSSPSRFVIGSFTPRQVGCGPGVGLGTMNSAADAECPGRSQVYIRKLTVFPRRG